MAFDRVVIGVDTVAQLVAAVNTNAGLSVFDASIDSSGVVSFLDDAAAVLFTLDTPGFPNQVTDGLVISTSGVSPNFAVDYTAGTYFFENASYDITPAASVALTAPDVTYPRVDAVFVDADGIVKVSDGTPAAYPVAPAVAGYVLGFVYLPKDGDGDPVVKVSGCCPDGEYAGQKLIWSGSQWLPAFNGAPYNVTTKPLTITPVAERIVFLPGADLGTFTLDAATVYDGLQYQITNLSGDLVTVDTDGINLSTIGTSFILGDKGSTALMYSLTANTWAVLY